MVRDLLRDAPQLAIVLKEIIGPPPGAAEAEPRPWDR
jgi:hypothetical protein